MAFRLRKPRRAFRIADLRFPIFDGAGAALYGGRWNSPGRRIIFAAETYAGALLEVLVHANIGRLPGTHRYVEIRIPAGVKVQEVEPDEVAGWDSAGEIASRAYGDSWYDKGRSAVLLVPSMVTRVERNVLIHQAHPDFPRITVSEPRRVRWDDRLFYR
jgi:RES domain-containing protein